VAVIAEAADDRRIRYNTRWVPKDWLECAPCFS
jgi:hypothetical protein